MTSRLHSLRQAMASRGVRRVASATSLGLAIASLVVLAIGSEGTPVTDVSLNDGSVWVTKQGEGVARLNAVVKEIDQGVIADSSDFDVLQSDGTVAMTTGGDTASVRIVDVATATTGDSVELPPGSNVQMGGDTVAMLDTASGKAWLRSASALSGFSPKGAPADIALGKGGLIAVGADGTAYGFDTEHNEVSRLAVRPGARAQVVERSDISTAKAETHQLAAAGAVPVVLDPVSGRLSWVDHDPATVAAGSVLQSYGSSSDRAFVAAQTGLQSVDLDSGDVTSYDEVAVNGTPAAPVTVNGCTYAAWADPASDSAFSLVCGGSITRHSAIPQVAATAQLVFRVNRDVVVLNDVTTGDGWLVQNSGLDRVSNWDALDPNRNEEEQKDDQTDDFVRTEKNHPPTAQDDELGARPGLDTVLPVTINDTDPDGDILAITAPTWTGGAEPSAIAVVGKGTQIQASFPPGATGASTIEYTVDDGRGGTAPATATVTLHPTDTNEPPHPIEGRDFEPVSITRGATSTLYVNPDWIDPDGDDVLLQSATTDGGTLRYRSDGVITFVDDGKRTGVKQIKITMSDGTSTSEGTVAVAVSGNKSLPPTLVADTVSGVAGSAIVVHPLANDHNPDGMPLSLVNAKAKPGYTVDVDPLEGTFTITGNAPGTTYVDYTAAGESGTSTSFVRVDLLPADGGNNPPVAVRDQSVLVPGGTSLVDVLANDSDADNDVLVVQRVIPAPGSGIKALLVDNHLLRLTTTRQIATPQAVRYTVSDGKTSAEGTVVVSAGQVGDRNLPPEAVNDAVTVRAGAVGRIPVLANDSDPDGDQLTLFQADLSAQSAEFPLFVSGRSYRLLAPKEPGEYSAVYGVQDTFGHVSTAVMSITVLADQPDGNRPPRPTPVVERTFDDRQVRVQVPLANSDPDGDAVTFTGITKTPKLGRIVGSGLDWFSYEPVGRPGSDSFQLAVQDKYGAQGVVDVRIGIVPRASINQAPVALDDFLRVRPGRTVAYNVLANDVDPDGDSLELDPTLTGGDGEVVDGAVQVTVPDGGPSEVTVGYRVLDPLDGSDTASLKVVGDPDGPLYAPVTKDDSADLSEITGKEVGAKIPVDVRANDGDLDGSREDLVVSAFDKKSEVLPDGRLQITLARGDQVVPYQVTDRDGQSSYGFVFVAGTETLPPIIDPKSIPVKVKAGELKRLPLAQYVLTRPGHEPMLTSADTISAILSDGSPLYDGKKTLLFRAPEDAYGPGSLTFQVTDGVSINDSDGLRALLTIPIDVTPVVPVPPEVRNVRVTAPLDGPPRSVDLRALASDANPGQAETLTYDITDDGDDLSADGAETGVVTLVPKDGAKPGGTTRVTYRAKDTDGKSSEGTIDVQFVGTDRPAVTLRAIQRDGQAGKKDSVDVADYLTNVSTDFPVTLEPATVAAGQAQVSTKGTTVNFTPAEGMSGNLVIQVRGTDDASDPDRAFAGQITVAVVGKPDTPGRPTATAQGSQTVQVSWPQAVDNGSPITDYTLFWKGGSRSCGRATTCVVTGLTDGKTYTFQVQAKNAVDTSEKSVPSNEVMPDTVPTKMSPPKVVATQVDGQVKVSWSSPKGEFSQVRGYEISTDTGKTLTVSGGKRTSTPFDGLTNGDETRFRILATNEQGPGEPSGYSSPVHSYGKPFAPTGLQATSPADGGLGRQVSVTWTLADDNGEAVTGQKVYLISGGGVVDSQPVSASQATATFSAENGKEYWFEIEATNPAGTGPRSGASNRVNPYGQSEAARGASKVKDFDRGSTISWQAPADTGGRPVAYYEVSSNGGNGVRVEGTRADVPFNSNNGPYTATITVYTDPGNGIQPLKGKSTTVGDLRPYGKPNPPNGSASPGYKSVSFNASPGSSNGRPVKGVQYNSNGWKNGAPPTTPTNQGGDRVCYDIRTVAEGGTGGEDYSDPVPVCGNAQARTVSVSKGAPYKTGNYVHVVVAGFQSNTNPGVHMTLNGSGGWCGGASNCQENRPINIGGDGRGTQDYYWNSISGQVCATVDGVQGCVQW